MITIPKWLFIFLCIISVLFLLAFLGIVFDIISQVTYEKHELQKFQNKQKEKGVINHGHEE